MEEERSQQQKQKQQQQQHVASPAGKRSGVDLQAMSARLPDKVTRVETRLENPTSFYMQQSQLRQVQEYLLHRDASTAEEMPNIVRESDGKGTKLKNPSVVNLQPSKLDPISTQLGPQQAAVTSAASFQQQPQNGKVTRVEKRQQNPTSLYMQQHQVQEYLLHRDSGTAEDMPNIVRDDGNGAKSKNHVAVNLQQSKLDLMQTQQLPTATDSEKP